MSGSSRTSRRARQTRLTFSALPSSSPAAAKYPTQIRDRAAAVRYDESPAKRRKISGIMVEVASLRSQDHQDVAAAENVDKMLPTPARSSQVKHVKGNHSSPEKSCPRNDEDDTSDSDPVRASHRQPPGSQGQKTNRRQATQRRLDFSNHIGRSRSPDTAYSPAINMFAPVRARTRPNSGIFSTSDSKAADLSEESSSSDTDSVQPSSPPRTQHSMRSSRETRSKAVQESRSPSPHRPVTRSSQATTTQRPTITISTDVSEEESDDVVVVNKGKRPLGKHAAAAIEIGEPETSGDDVIVTSPAKRRKRSSQHSIQPVRVRSSAQVISSDSSASSEEDLPDISKVQHSKPDIELDSSEEEDEDVDPGNSRRKKVPRTPNLNRRHKDQEQDELAEDLEFLGSSGRLRRSPTKLRSSASNPKRSQRENALELLKRRRAGEKAELPSSDPAPRERAKRALYDTESESDPNEDDAEQISDDPDELADEPVLQVHGAATQDMFLEDEYDQEFVVEDAEDTLGAPTQLPLEFSHISRMKSKDLFKYAVEWMVQKKINPAFAIKDELYDLAFKKLDDEVRGLAGSKFTSSAWTPEFTKSLQARPGITLSEITGAARTALLHHCDACNRRSHPATWDIQFYGKPYHEETLEEVSDEDDSESDGGNGTTYDSMGREIPSEDTIYHVGQFCMRNARTAHALVHWRYHLNEWVVDYLKQEGYTAPEKIVERDSWSTKRKMKYANTVVDEMEAAGEIRRLHHDFRIEIDNARNAKQSRWEYVQ